VTLVFVPDIQDIPRRKINILGGHNIGHSKQKVYIYMYPIPNGARCNVVGCGSMR
jgi:hypothetical protein